MIVAAAVATVLLLAGAARCEEGDTAPATSDREALARQAGALADVYKSQLGQGYRETIDNERHLIFVAALDKRRFDAVRARLQRTIDAHRTFLFTEPLRWNLSVIMPTLGAFRRFELPEGALGFYQQSTRTLFTVTLSETLLHELTHALHHNDQAVAGQRHPIWITEGLAMLCQHAEIVDGRLVPQPYRGLAEVQKAIREERSRDLGELCRMSQATFMENPEPNYFHVRSVMMFLYERGKLGAFYRAYKTGYGDDPTGVAALEETLGQPIAEVERQWRKWVLDSKPGWTPGYEQSAYLGIRMEPAERGVEVTGIVPGSSAAKAKVLKLGDVIISVAGQPTPDAPALTAAVKACRPGHTVDIEVIRDGRTQTLPHLLGMARH